MSTPAHDQQPANSNQYPQQPSIPQGYELRQKKPWYKKAGCIIPLILVLLMLLLLGSCTALFGSAINETEKMMNEEHTVTYRIQGDAQDATVTYSSDEMETAQDTGVQAGWEKEVKVKGFWSPHFTASNGMNDYGTITCQILSDGNVIAENTGSGQFASVTCNASTEDLGKK
ncbi:hypothetical protein [Corynebacterium tapiri]|uniref:MmpS family membrane protein n=1 Tax=Corynebacterium tapiri TaxID=1448266 RepID=A0A5C4U2F9_9CORY|nr:hypothetical protein [Corynebacterium tapiri]TNL96571.1 hypothetical protein FHE74_07685 [Corynebacterium tapiri]